MRKKYLKLTKDQKARGVIFSSLLVPTDGADRIEHEVFAPKSGGPVDMEVFREINRKIELLKEDSFFNSGPYKYNLIRQ